MSKHLFCIILVVLSCIMLIGCGGGSGDDGLSLNPANPVPVLDKCGSLDGYIDISENSSESRKNVSANGIQTIASGAIAVTKENNASAAVLLNASDSSKVLASNTTIMSDARMAKSNIDFTGATVWLENFPEIKASVESNGHYTLNNVPFGSHRVVAEYNKNGQKYKWQSEPQQVNNVIVVYVNQIVLQPANTNIVGIIYDASTQKPIQGVTVSVWGKTSTSDKNGEYKVFDMPEGSWDVTYQKAGYETYVATISFAKGNTSTANFYLMPQGISEEEKKQIASNTGLIQLSELIPAIRDTNIPTDSEIRAYYNGAKINTNYATVKFTSGNPKNTQGKIFFQNDRVVYKHSEPWPLNTKISGEIGSLKDFFGNYIASITFEFTTTANIIQSVVPNDGSVDIPLNAPIQLVFSNKMNKNQDLLQYISVVNVNNPSVNLIANSSQYKWSTDNSGKDMLTIEKVPLSPLTNYAIIVSNLLTSQDNSNLTGNLRFTFRTQSATTLHASVPTYTDKYGIYGMAPVNAKIKFAIQGSTISDISKAKVYFTSGQKEGSLKKEADGIYFILNKDQQWDFNNTVAGNIDGLVDDGGCQVTGGEFSFKVRPQASLVLDEYYFTAHSKLKFAARTIPVKDYSKAVINSLSVTGVSGVFSQESDCLVYTIDSGSSWPFASNITGVLTGLIDEEGAPMADLSFSFQTKEQTTLAFENNQYYENRRSANQWIYEDNSTSPVDRELVFYCSNGRIENIGDAKVVFTSGGKEGDLELHNGYIVLKLKSNTIWDLNTTVNGMLTGAVDSDGEAIPDAKFSFTTRKAIEIESPYSISKEGYQILPKNQLIPLNVVNYEMPINTDNAVVSIENFNAVGKFIKTNSGSLYGYALDDNKDWPKDKTLIIKISGLKDDEGGAVTDYSFRIITDYYSRDVNGNYLISTAEELDYIRNYSGGRSYKQTADIDLSAYGSGYDGGKGWNPLLDKDESNWNNNFDGDNYKITNLYINRPSRSDVGLFARSNLGCVVQNVNLEVSDIVGGDCSGGIMGSINSTTINNCNVSVMGDILGGSGVGSIAGYGFFGNKIINCKVSYKKDNIRLRGASIGGIIGFIAGDISILGCSVTGKNITTEDCSIVGGLVGVIQNSQINNSYVSLNIATKANVCGSLVGETGMLTRISNCYSKGNVENLSEGISYTGLIGHIPVCSEQYGLRIRNCVNLGNTITTNSDASEDVNCNRIIGFDDNSDAQTICNCYANGNMLINGNTVSGTNDSLNGANLPSNPDWQNEIFKDGYDVGYAYSDFWDNNNPPLLK